VTGPATSLLVGPCDWDPPADPPGWLEQLDRPVVLVTTSSEFQDDHRLEVARRVEVAGAGTRLPARRLRPDRLRAKVHEAIRLREGARRIQQRFAAAGGSSAAADAFETRLLHRELPQKLPSPTGPSILSRLLEVDPARAVWDHGGSAMTSAPAPATTNDKPTSHEAHDHGWSTRLGR
jgi:hypothetical protein